MRRLPVHIEAFQDRCLAGHGLSRSAHPDRLQYTQEHEQKEDNPARRGQCFGRDGRGAGQSGALFDPAVQRLWTAVRCGHTRNGASANLEQQHGRGRPTASILHSATTDSGHADLGRRRRRVSLPTSVTHVS